MAKTKTYDFDTIMSMSADQKRQIMPELVKAANQRLSRLEKHGETNWAYQRVMKDLKTPKGVAPRFSYAKISDATEAALNNRLSEVLRFLNSESSTVTGVRDINKRRIQSLRDGRLNMKIENEELFIAFLKSDTFKSLADQAASEFIMEDIDIAMSQNYTLDEILKGYDEFVKRDIGFNQVAGIRRAYRRHKKRKKKK
jgi:hypothetical protein